MNKVSIITISYNNRVELLKTMQSVFSQTSDNFEYIIIDGGSNDGSTELIQENSHKLTYWVSEKDTGIYNAMNKGIDRASGKYLMFLNSGDYLVDNEVISRCLALLEHKPEIDILYGNTLLDVQGKEGVERVVYTYPAIMDLKFLTNSTINHQASLIKASLFKEYGSYPENYTIASDYWMFLKCFLAGKRYEYFNHTLVKYDITGLSASEDYKPYLAEKKTIWEYLVPDYAKDIYCQHEALEKMTLEYEYWLDLWPIKMAVKFIKIVKIVKQKMHT